MSFKIVWEEGNAGYLRDRRTLYVLSGITLDFQLTSVTQRDLDQLWDKNGLDLEKVPKLEPSKEGVLIFYKGGKLSIEDIEIKNSEVKSIQIKREFPEKEDKDIKAILLADYSPFEQLGFLF